jgi:hypothetical protein
MSTHSHSTQPWGLKVLDMLQEEAPKWCCCYDALDLQQIACGEDLERHADALLDGNWVAQFLPSLNWWIQVATAIANGRDPEFRSDVADVAFQGEFPQLLERLLQAYCAALKGTCDFAGLDQDGEQKAALELFRLYWQLTDQIRAKALEIWPEVDLAWLWVQP